jgi:hypothetical protein
MLQHISLLLFSIKKSRSKKKVCFARFKNGFAETKKKAFGTIPKAFFYNLFFAESYQSTQLIFVRKLSICGFSPCGAKVKRFLEFPNFFYNFAVKNLP